MSTDQPAPPAVRCEDLSVARRGLARRVVDGVDISLEAGHALAVMGPTGAGKSSLAALLAGAERGISVDGGQAWVTGIDVRAGGRRRRLREYRTGYVGQRAGADLPPRDTVAEVIEHPITSRDRRVGRRALAERVATLLDELHLPLGAAAKYPYELSAGMRQRVAIARALILDPALLVADEVFAGIDIDVRPAVRAALERRMRAGTALLLVTNEADVADALGAEILVLRDGFPVATGGSTADLAWTPDGSARTLG